MVSADFLLTPSARAACSDADFHRWWGDVDSSDLHYIVASLFLQSGFFSFCLFVFVLKIGDNCE